MSCSSSSSILSTAISSKVHNFQAPSSRLALPIFHINHPSFSRSFSSLQKTKDTCIHALNASQINPEEKQETQNAEEDYQVLGAIRSNYNDIVVVDTLKSRFLLLDSTYNVHSIFNKDDSNNWTNAYWDEFSTLPPIVPKGPIALYGLGGGTAAHLMLELWPELEIDGWEIDEVLISVSKDYLGLSRLEQRNSAGGVLNVRIGDALSPSSVAEGGYAGIIVDLFAEGKVLKEMEEEATWVEMKKKLMPGGRIMVNCGGAGDKGVTEELVVNATVKAVSKAFPGSLNWKKMAIDVGANYLAVTGPLPDLEQWSASVPERLRSSVLQWMSFQDLGDTDC